MGADTFSQVGTGNTVAEAFAIARDEAAYEHGHGGYSGTLAEKRDYVEIVVPPDWKDRPTDYARHLIDAGDERIDDKWGPAGAIQLEPGKWLFFGWASC